MNTYDDEATRYDCENNNFSDPESVNYKNEQENCAEGMNDAENPESKKGKGKWVNIGIGAASGVLIGGVSTFLMGMSPNPDSEESVSDVPAWSDGKIAVATSVNDDMPFGEAFAAARAEVGPGGAFEWHGNVYATYTADEWNGMTAQERHDFGDHFSWNHYEGGASSVAEHTGVQEHDDLASHTAPHIGAHKQAEGGDDIEVVSVDHPAGTEQQVAQNPADMAGHGETEGTPEIEVLGVVHNSESNSNIGGMSIDGQDVIVIDVDNDLTFDVLATDINGNGLMEDEEVFDIHNENLTVDDLGGFTDGTHPADMYTGAEPGLADTGMDYTDDGSYTG